MSLPAICPGKMVSVPCREESICGSWHVPGFLKFRIIPLSANVSMRVCVCVPAPVAINN